MTEKDVDLIGRWLFNTGFHGMMKEIDWPEVSEDIRAYSYHNERPPVPGCIDEHLLKYPFSYQKRHFWVVYDDEEDLWYYEGPDELLPDLQTLILFDELATPMY